MRWMTVCGLTALIGMACLHAPSVQAETLSLDVAFERLGFSDADKQSVLGGKIVSVDLKQARDDQLIAAVAVPIAVPLEKLVAPLKDGSNIGLDTGTLAWGAVAAGSPDDFAKAGYDDGEKDEVSKLLTGDAGGDFNFSADERALLKERLGGLDAAGADSAQKAAEAYREILAARADAYAKGGLESVASYDAGGTELSAAKELRSVQEQAKDFLTSYFPDFWSALSGYPQQQPESVSSGIYWAKRTVEGRPAFILIHQLVQSGEGFALTAQRQFYVGHTYEALQMFAFALPSEQGAVIFSVNSVFTDQITGFFSGVALSVGQERTRDSMTEHFEKVRRDMQ